MLRVLWLCLILALIPAGIPIEADSSSYKSVLIPAGPTFHPVDPASREVANNGKTYYHAQPFRVSQDGIYYIDNVSNTFPTQDSVLLLYSPSFDHARPLENYVYGNDDRSTDRRALLQQSLVVNTPYVLVTTTWDFMTTGEFVNSITGSGIIQYGDN